jgi:hypothetical protein
MTDETDERLDRLAEICLALPEAAQVPAANHASFQVRGKNFAWYLDDHHGDGRVALVCKAPRGVQHELIASDPSKFFMPAYLGPKGWIGLRLDLETGVDWAEVTELVRDSYLLIAPRRLAASVE